MRDLRELVKRAKGYAAGMSYDNPADGNVKHTLLELAAALDQVRRRELTCDQVAWLLDAINRYLPTSKHPRVSREREVLAYGLLYEIMGVACLTFQDEAALSNGTPSRPPLAQQLGPLDAERLADGMAVNAGNRTQAAQ